MGANNVGSTNVALDHAGDWAENAIWFQWTAPLTGRVTFKTAGSSFDTVIDAYIVDAGATNTAVLDNSMADDVDIDDLTSQITFDVEKDIVYHIAVAGTAFSPSNQSGQIILSWTSGSQTAGHFKFAKDTFIVSEGDSASPRDPFVAFTSDTQARITLTRDQGSTGAVDVYMSYESYTTTNLYMTNQIDGTNFIVNLLDGATTVTNTFDAGGLPVWRAVDFIVPYITNIYADSISVTGRFISVTITPDLTNVIVTNITRTPQFTLITQIFNTNHFGKTLDFLNVSNNLTIASGQNTNFVGKVAWSNSVAGGAWTTNYTPVDLDPVLNFNVTVTTNATNVIATETLQPWVPDVIPPVHFKDYEMSKSVLVPIPQDTTPNADRILPLSIDYAELDPSEDPNIEPPTFDGGTATLKVLDDDLTRGLPTLYFERRHFIVSEANNVATIYVQRKGPLGEAVDINFEVAPISVANSFATEAGSDYAIPDSDFLSSSGTLHWDTTDNTPKPIDIVIGNDTTPEFNEDFFVRLFPVPNNPGTLNPGNRDSIVTIKFDDESAGSLDRNYNTKSEAVPLPGANGAVFAIAAQPPGNGRAFIGGDFGSVNGKPIIRIARLFSNGQLDTTFDPGSGPNGFVSCLIPNGDGSVLIGGDFTSINGFNRYHVAKLNSGGAVDQTFDPGSAIDGTVWAIAAQPDGKILIGGDFTHINGNLRKHVARLNADGSLDSTFDTSSGPDGSVLALAYNAGQVLIGGDFAMISTSVRNGIAQLNADGSLDSYFDPGDGVDGAVHTIAVESNGKILIGGAFNTYDFRTRNGIAQIDAFGFLDASYDPGTGFNDTVYSITIQPLDGKAIVAGKFTSYNSTRRVGIARLFVNGYLDTSFMDTAYNQFAGVVNDLNIEPRNFVFSAALQSNGAVLIGGNFSQVGGGNTRTEVSARNNFARLVGGATTGPGNVQLSFDNYSADENNLPVGNAIERINGDLGGVEVVFDLVSPPQGPGVADPSDYSFGGPVSVKWGASTSWMISSGSTAIMYPTITAVTDPVVEGNEITYFQLSDPTGTNFFVGGERIPLGTALGRQRATLTIIDGTKQRGTLAFSNATFQVDETASYALITVIRTNGNFGAASVQFATSGGTATSADYYATNGTIDFAAGATSATFKIFIKDDTELETNETIGISLFNPSPAGVTLAPNGSSAVLSIVDDDLFEGRVGFSATNYNVSENVGFVTVTVNRDAGSQGQLLVQYSTTDGSAVNGVDYIGTTNTLIWENNDSTPKTFTIPIINNTNVDGDRTVTLQLFNPSISNVLSLGTITNATITIKNEDAFGLFSFSSTNYHVNENSQSLTVVVVRNGGTNGTVSVAYSTSESTNINSAHAGTNYAAQSGILTFLPGQISASFDVGIFHNPDTDPTNTITRYFSLSLSNPAPAGAGLGSWSNALVTITDAERFYEPAGSVDPTFNFTLGANDNVYAVAVQDASIQGEEKLIIGGDFTQVNGITRRRIARINANGTLDKSFLASSVGINGSVRTVVSQSVNTNSAGRVIIGGSFNLVNNVNRSNIARLNLDGTLDATFNPGSGANGPVYCISETLVDGAPKILAAGSFNVFNGQTKLNLIRLNPDGSFDSTFDTGLGVNGTIYAMALQPDGKIVIGGDFTMVDNVARYRVARLNVDGSLDLTFDAGAGPDSNVRAIAVHYDGGILVGGEFTSFAGNSKAHLVRLDPHGNLDLSFNPEPNGVVHAISVQSDGRINVGGDFSVVNNVTRGKLTRLKADGSVDPKINFGTGADGAVFAITLQSDEKIVIGGGFTQFDGVNRPHVARLFGGEFSGAGAVEFTSPLFAVKETDAIALVGIRRRGGTEQTGTPVRVQFDTSDFTGTNGLDYLSVNTVIEFAEGETFTTISIPILHNLGRLVDSSVKLTLSNPEGNLVITNQPNAVLVISNTDCLISFSTNNYNANENDISGFATVNLVRSGSLLGTVSVDCTTLGGNAVPNIRYFTTNSTIVFGDGETTKPFSVRLINDNVVNDNQTIGLVLTSFQNASPGLITNATITVIEDDFGPGFFSFGATNYSVNEAGGVANVQLMRTGGSNGIVSVQYLVSGGTATAGVDYTDGTGTVVFANGQTSTNIQLGIINDSLLEGPETVNIYLANPSNGAQLGTPANTVLTIVDDDVANFVPAGSALVLENSNPTNGMIDPGETVTVQLAVRNVGSVNVTNLTATLQSGGGITRITTSGNYGTVKAGGNSVSRSFQFIANGANGGSITATLQLSAPGFPNLGSVAFPYVLGVSSTKFTNSTAITINDNAPASPYPSAINVLGMPNSVTGVTVTLSNLTHSFANDIQALLVGPGGQSCVLMANCGPVANGVTLTFDDAATNSLQTNQVLVSGSFKPSKNGFTTFPTNNSPVGPYGTTMSVFNGTNPNGTWLLFIYDGSASAAGMIANGWSLSFLSSNIVTASADLATTVVAAPGTVLGNKPIVYTVNVSNNGPGTANNVTVTNILPPGVTYVSASRAVTVNGSSVICNFGTIANGGTATLVLTNIGPATAGNFTNFVTIGSAQADLNPDNNSTNAVVNVLGLPALTSSVVITNANFQFSFYGQAGYTYIVDGSTNLINWIPLWTNSVQVNGNFQFIDTSAPNGGRFYRLRVP